MMNFEENLQSALEALAKGGTIAYPTDTIWGLGCDATNESAIKQIYILKQREESKSLIIMVSSVEMLKTIVPTFDENILSFLKQQERPTTVIYSNPKGLAKNVLAVDGTVGIRWVHEPFCQQLIERFGKPIVSTSANISGEPSPTCFDDIDKTLLDKVDYVVNLHLDKKSGQSSIIVRWQTNEEIEYIRK
ncbi:L-threonylcarbamoyladenylate synthase [Namhaeicola litoreus]|uniref:L-threonylcarbamoyladenylate synthase n=1 Tax=Namhaeicola litoreus TaxID=1052145 RepID=A0ABW3Y255_9FLAO